MKVLERIGLTRAADVSRAAAEFAAADTVTVPVSAVSHPSASTYRAERVALSIARSIPAVRRAERAILRLARFPLVAYAGDQALAPNDPRSGWLRQPDPRRPLRWLLARTLQDGIWHDRAVWRITDRTLDNRPWHFERVHPDRISTIEAPHDPDTVDAWIVDGHLLDRDEFARNHLVFDFGGLGGLSRFGAPLLGLYADLQAAAGNYARAPHPKAILLNEGGAELDEDEVDALLLEWEQARNESSVGYLDGLKYQTHGWNAQELQLTEAREHAALEVARLFGLPAFAVDAKAGDPMTYSTLVDRRRDLIDAVEDWGDVIEGTLSLDDRRSRPTGLVLPAGVTARLVTDDYLTEKPADRMTTWREALDLELVDLEDVKRLEPLARSRTYAR